MANTSTKFSWDVFAIKITSRKLWISIAGLATSIMAYMNCDSNTIVQVTSIIGAVGTVVGYLIANGLSDSGDEGSTTTSSISDESTEASTTNA